MPEWFMGVDCKSIEIVIIGSNPIRPNNFNKKKTELLGLAGLEPALLT